MAENNEIKVPDIGGATDVDVIEVLVKVGDEVEKDSSLITLESDKASMEIPSPVAGIVREIKLDVGDKASEGDVILILENQSEENAQKETQSNLSDDKENGDKENIQKSHTEEDKSSKKTKSEQSIDIPDIGGATDVDVIEVFVKEGDKINKDDSLITLESDKASMEIPSPASGTVKTVQLTVGDKVSAGDLILTLITSESGEDASLKEKSTEEQEGHTEEEAEKGSSSALKEPEVDVAPSSGALTATNDLNKEDMVFAGPSVRRLARELGVELNDVKGTGRKSRILKEDVQSYVKERLAKQTSETGFSLPQAPSIDFSKFGDIETKPLNKIKRLTGDNVHRSWLTIPHVTQFDEADITSLEDFRKREGEKTKQEGYKLTLLAFVCKIVAQALSAFPQFNSSLDETGQQLIYKHYFNVGVAVDTPNGLLVPVIRHVDELSVSEIAKEMARLSQKARDKGLMPADMQGGCFTISSLGGIGGTAFTPIVNAPEVAILGLSRAVIKAVYQDGKFVPKLMLPLSLSYDHRVIDGAEAARFTRFLAEKLEDIRKVLL